MTTTNDLTDCLGGDIIDSRLPLSIANHAAALLEKKQRELELWESIAKNIQRLVDTGWTPAPKR
jgi:hypothetical protein